MARDETELLEMGARIKELREAHGFKQQWIADQIGVTLRTYQFWQAGTSPPEQENLEKLATLFGVTPKYILKGETPAPIHDRGEQLDRIEQTLNALTLMTEQQRHEIAARIRDLMAREGLSNSALARRADLSEKTISRLLNPGEMDPRYKTLERVAKALGVEEKDLRGTPSAPLGFVDAAGGGTDAAAAIIQRLDRVETLLERVATAVLSDAVVAEVEKSLGQKAPASGRQAQGQERARRAAG